MPGAYITRVWGAAAGLVDRIGIGCSDGTLFTPVGGTGGNVFDVNSTQGFIGVEVRSLGCSPRPLRAHGCGGVCIAARCLGSLLVLERSPRSPAPHRHL